MRSGQQSSDIYLRPQFDPAIVVDTGRMLSGILRDLKEMTAEQVDCWELLYQLTLRDLKLRYKQTAMGFGWAVFMPLLNTALFSVIFTRVAPLETGAPYPVWSYCGLAVWNFFASGVKFATNSLSSNISLVTKVYFQIGRAHV